MRLIWQEETENPKSIRWNSIPSTNCLRRDRRLQRARAAPRIRVRQAEERSGTALLDRLARLQAEFENARKRAAREQQEFREYAVADALKALLPILDSFERALQTSAADKSEFRSGVELIYKQLQDALAKLGLQPIPAKGEPLILIFTRPLKWWTRGSRRSSCARRIAARLQIERPAAASFDGEGRAQSQALNPV